MNGWRLSRLQTLIGLVALCFVVATGCDVKLPIEGLGLFDTPTPPPQPTPVGDTLTYVVPQFPVELGQNQLVPGSRLEFVSKSGDLYSLKVNGLSAERQVGDSWQWNGVVSPGVLGNYQMTLQRTAVDDRLLANGQVVLTVLQPSPLELEPPVRSTEPLRFNDIAINHIVPQGAAIPGTSLVYVGQQAQSGQLEFSGTSNYPLFNVGDTLRWRGALRPNVFIINDLKIIGLESVGLRLQGSADLIIYQNSNP